MTFDPQYARGKGAWERARVTQEKTREREFEMSQNIGREVMKGSLMYRKKGTWKVRVMC